MGNGIRWPCPLRHGALLPSRLPSAAPRRRDAEVVDPLTRFKQSNQPAGLFATTRPGLGRIIRISVFWRNDRIRPTLAIQNIELCRPVLRARWIELLKALLQHNFF